jgi:hypothetical protein
MVSDNTKQRKTFCKNGIFKRLRVYYARKEGTGMSGAKTFAQAIQKGGTGRLAIMKSDDDKRLVFGWASVAVRATGEVIEDQQDDIIEIDELERAAYDFTADFGTAGEMHERGGVGRLVESVVFTKEKAAAMGIPDGYMPEGWWVGFRIDDAEVWQKVKDGAYSMFSIEGTAIRQEA